MRIFTDPHLGCDRKSHTTGDSRKLLAETLALYASKAVAGADVGSVVCAGDLFDKFSNTEETIIRAAVSAAKCDVVLAGNHDSLNQRDVVGSLEVVNQLLPHTTVITCEDFALPFVEYGEA